MKTVPSVLGPFLVWDQDHLGQVLQSGAFWDAQLKPYLDSADTTGWAIDVGANVGFLTRYLSIRHPHVLAVEAHPGTFAALKENLAGSLNVEVIEGVAYDREATFMLAPGEALGWPIPADLNACPNASSVAFVRAWPGPHRGVVLDTFVPLNAFVSLIKVDVQGCDLRALRGLQHTIDRCRPLILFEFEEAASSWHGDDWADYMNFFSRRQYRVRRIRMDIWDYVATPDENP